MPNWSIILFLKSQKKVLNSERNAILLDFSPPIPRISRVNHQILQYLIISWNIVTQHSIIHRNTEEIHCWWFSAVLWLIIVFLDIYPKYPLVWIIISRHAFRSIPTSRQPWFRAVTHQTISDWCEHKTRRGNVHTDSNGYPSRMSFSVWRQTCWNCRPQFSMSQSVGVCLFHFRHITRSSVHWSGGALSLMCTRSPTSVESFEKRPMFLRRTFYNTCSSWKSFQISTAT